VGDDEVEDLIAEAKMLSMGREQKLPYVEREGKFDYDAFRKFVQYTWPCRPSRSSSNSGAS